MLYNSVSQFLFSVFRYETSGKRWSLTAGRDEPDSFSFYCEPQPGTLWIMGGGPDTDLDSSTYLLRQPEGMRRGPELPEANAYACAVRINDTHTFMAGKKDAF